MTAIPDGNKVDAVAVELRLDRLARLYNSLDPSPFREKELDAAVDAYIIGYAEDLGGKPMRLAVLMAEQELRQTQAADIIESIHNHFAWREQVERRRLHSELRRGRRSLAIGLVFLVACLVIRELLPAPGTPIDRILRESLLIVGWVAMWGPLDVFLYGWWPIAGQRRLFARLAKIDIEVRALK
jgi:hypothetical protein